MKMDGGRNIRVAAPPAGILVHDVADGSWWRGHGQARKQARRLTQVAGVLAVVLVVVWAAWIAGGGR